MTTQIPSWARLEAKTIVYDPNLLVRHVFDGSTGLYQCGEDEPEESIIIQPIKYRTHYSARYGREPQNWLDVAFISEDDIVSILSLNKASAVEMSLFFARLQKEGVAMQAIRVCMQSREREVVVIDEENGEESTDSYFVVAPDEYEFATEERFNEACQVAEDFYWNLVGEVSRK